MSSETPNEAGQAGPGPVEQQAGEMAAPEVQEPASQKEADAPQADAPSGAVVEPPAARPPRKRMSDRDRKILTWAGIVVLVLLVVGGTFAAGFAAGNSDGSHNRVASPRQFQRLAPRGRFGPMQSPQMGATPEMRGLRGDVRDGEGQVVNGSVSAVGGGSLTVDTSGGSVTFSLTAQTRVTGVANPGTGTSATDQIKSGDQVTVVGTNNQAGKPEAAVIRVLKTK